MKVDTEDAVGTRDVAAAVDWDAVYAKHAAALLGYLRRLTRDQETAEDLMQTTFARAIAAERVPDSTGITPWLYRIATNLVIDHGRRSRRFQFISFTGHEAAPPAPSGEEDGVRVALRSLPTELAVTLVLRLHEGFSRTEIATMTGVSERRVKWRLEQGRIAFAAAYAGVMENDRG